MSNGTRWLSRFKKEKGEEVDSNFINYKLSLYNLNKTTLPILYINLYTGVALHLHPLKKKSPLTLHPAPPPFWMPFEGKWHVYLNNYFTVDGMTNIYTITSKQKARKSKEMGLLHRRRENPKENTQFQYLVMAEGLLTRPISYSLLCESIFLFGTFFLGSLPVLDECDYIFYVYIPSIFRFKSYAPTPSPGQFWQVLPNNGLWKLYLRISSKQNV